MSHIDTLRVYEDAIRSGYSEQEARFHVKSLDDAFDGVDAIRKAELDLSISGVMREIELLRKNFSFLKWINAGILAIIGVPVLEKLALLYFHH